MTESSNMEVLKEEIIKRSRAKNWYEAKTEWQLITVFDEHDQTCLCGRTPITENCLIGNIFTYEQVVVGNVCINKFDEEKLTVPPSARKSLKKIILDPIKNKASVTLLALSRKLSIITTTDFNDYSNTIRKRNISSEEAGMRFRINTIISNTFINHGIKCRHCNELMYVKRINAKRNVLNDMGFFYCCKRDHGGKESLGNFFKPKNVVFGRAPREF